jgi:hypothetical protein
MKVGDLVGIGWNGKLKKPFVAVITRVSSIEGYAVLVLATGNKTFALKSDLRRLNESR